MPSTSKNYRQISENTTFEIANREDLKLHLIKNKTENKVENSFRKGRPRKETPLPELQTPQRRTRGRGRGRSPDTQTRASRHQPGPKPGPSGLSHRPQRTTKRTNKTAPQIEVDDDIYDSNENCVENEEFAPKIGTPFTLGSNMDEETDDEIPDLDEDIPDPDAEIPNPEDFVRNKTLTLLAVRE